MKVEVGVDCDTNRLYGDLPTAIKYLTEIHEKYPTARLNEHWVGHEDMEMRFVFYRDETEKEIGDRLEKEQKQRDHNRRMLEAEEQRAKRRKEYYRLREEFGY